MSCATAKRLAEKVRLGLVEPISPAPPVPASVKQWRTLFAAEQAKYAGLPGGAEITARAQQIIARCFAAQVRSGRAHVEDVERVTIEAFLVAALDLREGDEDQQAVWGEPFRRYEQYTAPREL